MPITLSADFDGGNVEVLGNKGTTYELAIRTDHNSHYFQWFCFRVDGAKGQALTLRLTNAGQSAYTGGWENYKARVTAGDDWVQVEDTSYADGVLTIRYTPDADRVTFAYFPPFDSDRHCAFIEQIKQMPGMSHRVLGQSLDGRDLDLFTVGNGPIRVWLYARQHPGETMAEYWMEGALPYLTSDDEVAKRLRAAAIFFIVPNMNPDGSARGHLRTNAAGVDLNREWAGPTAERSPEIVAIMGAMDELGCDFAIDVHGDEAIPHVFMAGFEGTPSWTHERQHVYNRYLANIGEQTPDFQTKFGYPVATQANLAISTNAVAQRYIAIAMTLEMPFKDHDDAPDAVHGWSIQRSRDLGVACLKALDASMDDLEKLTGR